VTTTCYQSRPRGTKRGSWTASRPVWLCHARDRLGQLITQGGLAARDVV
jgi:hypothetical protein